LVYYGAADKVIGVALGNLEEIAERLARQFKKKIQQ
jgi:predicted GH43/DUF377 family glycosyl hydrolase